MRVCDGVVVEYSFKSGKIEYPMEGRLFRNCRKTLEDHFCREGKMEESEEGLHPKVDWCGQFVIRDTSSATCRTFGEVELDS